MVNVLFKKKVYAKNGISPVIATVIIVAVSIAIAIAVAFWVSGLLGATGYGTRPVKLAIYSDLELYGEYFVVLVKNLGSDTVYIDKLFIDGKPVSYIFDAQTYPTPGEARWFYESGSGIIVYINPGETVQIKGVIKNISLEPGVTHQLSIHTTLGLEFHRELNAKVVSPVAFPSGGVVAYDTGLKDPSDPSKKIILIYLKIENQWEENLEISKVEFYDPDTRAKLGEKVFQTPIVVHPNEVWEPKRLSEYIKVSLNPGQYIINVTWQCGTRGGGLASFLEVSGENIPIVIIAITGTEGWWVNPDPIINLAKQFTTNVIEIRDMNALYNFIENPSIEKAIVINTHGEAVPIPRQYVEGDPPNGNPKWRDWFTKIRDDISTYQWIWVSVDGYPFYRVSNPSYTEWRLGPYHGITSGNGPTTQGVQIFLPGIRIGSGGGVITYDGKQYNDYHWELGSRQCTRGDLTSLGRDVEKMFGYDLPDNLSAGRSAGNINPVQVNGISIVFYERGNGYGQPYSSALFSIGSGYLLINGWSPKNNIVLENDIPVLSDVEDEDIAYTAVLLAIYSYLIVFVTGSP